MLKKRFVHRLEEVILAALILLNVLDFFEILPADLDYAKKIISWTALGYVLYKASLTKIFFGNHHPHVDILLIVSYFMLIFKNIILFSYGVLEEFVFFFDFQRFIVDNSSLLELYSLIIGSVFVLLIAVYSTFFIEVRKPSLMHIIHEEGRPKNPYGFMIRTTTIYLVYIAFFVVVFNLVMEWLAIAIDAPLIMFALLFYVFIVSRHYKKYSVESVIFKIGEFGEKFYEKFISLFHYKRTILLGISGMLVLHLLTDALSFVIPYVFNFKDPLYFTHLGPNHDSLVHLFFRQIVGSSFTEQVSLLIIYLLNTLAIIFLLVLPSFLWYVAFSGKKYTFKRSTAVLLAVSLFVLLMAPVFSISRLESKPVVGVDIQTHQTGNLIFSSFFTVIIAAFAVGIAAFLLTRKKRLILSILILISLGFFTYYIYLFFTSFFLYYTGIIATIPSSSGSGLCKTLLPGICQSIVPPVKLMLSLMSYVLSLHLLIFFTITILFYVSGFIMYIDELIKEKVYKKIS